MVQPNRIPHSAAERSAAWKAVCRTTETIEQTFREIPETVAATMVAAVSTARIIVTAEEKLRRRVRSTVRVALATLFLGISSLISLGANVTMAFAKKISPEATRDKRAGQPKGRTRYQLHNPERPHEESADARAAAQVVVAPHHYHLRGVASWYGKKFDHKKTASGVQFNTHKMMAAHRTLPFGTKVRVTNLSNHKTCVVEITDRGPYIGNRVIDLSYAAAEQIGLTKTGTAEVKLEVLNPKDVGIEGVSPDIASGSDHAIDVLERPVPIFDGIPAGRTFFFPSSPLAGDSPIASEPH